MTKSHVVVSRDPVPRTSVMPMIRENIWLFVDEARVLGISEERIQRDNLQDSFGAQTVGYACTISLGPLDRSSGSEASSLQRVSISPA
jgi:hypothetical protein